MGVWGRGRLISLSSPLIHTPGYSQAKEAEMPTMQIQLVVFCRVGLYHLLIFWV
jgi:hypothetical protein